MRLARFSNGSLDYFIGQPIWRLVNWAGIANRIATEEAAAAGK